MLPWRRHAPHPLPGRGSRAWSLRLSPLPPPPPIPSLALQPRSCIAPWRPSSELSHGRKWQGAAHGEIAESSGQLPCRWILLPAAGARGQGPQSGSLSSLTQRPSERTRLSPRLAPALAQVGLGLLDDGRLLGKILHPFGGLLLPLPSAPT